MVASSILPVALHKGKLYFLFGKENEMEDSAKGFSDFGGRVEDGESIMETAFREGSEELCGFLGDETVIKCMLKRGGIYKVVHNGYHVHIFVMEYDENLPRYFTNHHRFLWDRMDKHLLNDSKYFEKQELKWFTPKMMKKNIREFRNFYQEIVSLLLKDLQKIRQFIEKKKSKNKKTRSNKKTMKLMKGG
jgi:8-oxo-dGTP pyrophosphatase MutT (NUDIX family)